jgi:hypothetical protein
VNIDSSFLRLFRQSRYAADDESRLPRQNRRELFAVAAVAFAAKHDQAFARDFLVRVAGVPRFDLEHDFKLEPQKAYCADLAITDQTSKERYVVEFKISAPVMEKQHSRSKMFDKPGGYGRAFRERLSGVSVYTTVAQQRDFDDFAKSGLRHRARTWRELIPANGKEGQLLEDLLDSLGELGISVLRLRKIKHMKNAKHALTTVNIQDLLRSILDEFKKAPLDVDSDDIYNWVGMYVRPRPKQHSELRKWLGHNWSHVAWIGYLLPKNNDKPELSVWLSFQDKLIARRDESIRALRKVIRGAHIEASPKFNDLIVKVTASHVRDERKWFSDTLETVLQCAKPRRGK